MPSHQEILKLSAIHEEALAISKNLQRDEFKMLEVLQRVDKLKVYRHMKYKSLFQYATIGLKLSEDRAYNFITVARKAAQIDKFQQVLQRNELTLSKAKRISSVINNENAEEWLNQAKGLSQRQLERAVAKVNPRSAVEEGTRYVTENTLELRVALTPQAESRLRRCQEILSQKEQRAVSLEETISLVNTFFLEKNDPVVKAAKFLRKHSSQRRVSDSKKPFPKKQATPELTNSLARRASLTAKLRHEISLRDQGKCQQVDCHSEHNAPGAPVCGDARWIDFHHIIPVHQGGLNTLENLVTLCRAHHQMRHLDSRPH